MKDKKIKMMQRSKYKWDLVSPKGFVMVEDIIISSQYEAEEYAKKYISSYIGWSYEIVIKEEL